MPLCPPWPLGYATATAFSEFVSQAEAVADPSQAQSTTQLRGGGHWASFVALEASADTNPLKKVFC